ncbi:MAG TPA: BamA/TamA family outer membrane protein [Puia sp.]|nr:BamA/TamA family outer membrane protein [Puia sp.]
MNKRSASYRVILCILFFVLGFVSLVRAQEPKKHISLKDSLDHAFDLSEYIIDAKGFVPIPYIITEPSLGSFGLALAPVFLKKKPPYIDSVDGRRRITPVAPDITGGFAAYTLNKTWMLGLFRSGTLVKSRIKYRVGGAYANVNMAFYHTFPQVGEKEFNFNFRTIPVFLQAIKRIQFSNWYVGLKYLFLKTDLHYTGTLPSFVKPIDTSSTVSLLGAVVELDNRDNIFTPDRGMKVHFDVGNSGNYFGSDYNYWRMNYYMYAYKPISSKLVGGWRVDGQQSLGSPPFYLLPYIDMRGVPAVRYQGNADILTELEARWDFIKRWSIVGFGGTGKAFDEWSDFGSAKWVVSGGVGFRYLVAREFGLRMGVDLARGPDTWAYYIVFGSNWLK